MKCPKCVELDLKSILTGGDSCSTTLMCHESYHDEEGKYHNHDPNTSSYLYRCSNGHNIQIVRTSSCPNCDYGNKPPKVYFFVRGEKAVELDPELLEQCPVSRVVITPGLHPDDGGSIPSRGTKS